LCSVYGISRTVENKGVAVLNSVKYRVVSVWLDAHFVNFG